MRTAVVPDPRLDDQLRDEELSPWGPGAPHPIWVPEAPRLEGLELIWEARGGLIDLEPRFPERELLTEFVGLADGPDAGVRDYAARWGPLHPQPFGRMSESVMRPGFWPASGHKLPCATSGWPDGQWREPLESWRTRARQARSALAIVSALNGDQLGRLQDWHRLFPWAADEPSVLRRVSELPLGPAEFPAHVRAWWRGYDRNKAWDWMRGFITRWIEEANVRPRLFIAFRGRRSVTLGGGGLLGALTVQLLYAITRTHGLVTCSACQGTFTPPRQPAPGRRRYCPACRESGAPARDATRAHAQRRAEAYRLHLEGIDDPAIAARFGTSLRTIQTWLRREHQGKARNRTAGRASRSIRA
jgi:hypothetical protein